MQFFERNTSIPYPATARQPPFDGDATLLTNGASLERLAARAAMVRDTGFGDVVTYSRKVFIPLTRLCRDKCGYCCFARPPSKTVEHYLSREEVLDIARAGAAVGCKEALFTLGDKPELRYPSARKALEALGHETTAAYLAEVASMVVRETGLLPHLNCGVMDASELRLLRSVAASMGLMLESSASRLAQRGGPHFGSPDKDPRRRLDMIAAAGIASIPFTSGILIGIGETRRERIESLLALRELHERHSHLQEIIVQSFRPKKGTPMESAPEPTLDELVWTISVARLIFGPHMTIQAPPNLSAGSLMRLIDAGINDWGGVSPVTPDHVNPERPWPEIEELARDTAAAGKILAERLAIYPAYVSDPARWIDEKMRPTVIRLADGEGLGKEGTWKPGAEGALDGLPRRISPIRRRSAARDLQDRAIGKASEGRTLDEAEVELLFRARGDDFWHICAAADRLRRERSGDAVTYVINRNINYTNVCYFHCQFCAFSHGKSGESRKERPYNLDYAEIGRRAEEARERGATEICLQGGIHPKYSGDTYLEIVRTVRAAAPGLHIHAFSPLEIRHGAATLRIPVAEFLLQLKEEGLCSLPGTAAEILDDEVRRVICPDKLTTTEWLEVMQTAHEHGIRSTATIMFGHVDRPSHWARHLLRIQELQSQTGGFTEFVPLPFVPMNTPLFLSGNAREGATVRESILMHAVARLVLHPLIGNIQTSWAKMGPAGALECLQAGANDLGGTLMNESISRAAGAVHGQELRKDQLESLIRSIGRVPKQRTTFYGDPPRTCDEPVGASANRRRP